MTHAARGNHYILGAAVKGGGESLRAHDPVTGLPIAPSWQSVSNQDITRACEAASAAAHSFRDSAPSARATLLDAVASTIESRSDVIVHRAVQETAYDAHRLRGELSRTCGQLREFANLLRDGRSIDARLDRGAGGLGFMRIAVGPVAVFAASNFPLAFSAAGGDTAAALAAGCPVVVNGHPAHPGTGELVAACVIEAVANCGFEPGVFSWFVGRGHTPGSQLVKHPAIRAVGFTGSRAGGLALMKLAAQRPVPIPVYAEMSSINPVFLLPAALARRGVDLGNQFLDSLCLGVGQFCTNPGLLVAVQGQALDVFEQHVAAALSTRAPSPLLSDGIRQAYVSATAALAQRSDVHASAYRQLDNEQGVTPALFTTTANTFIKTPSLSNEVFGPAALIVRCTSTAEMITVARALEGQLTASLQCDDDDIPLARALLPDLSERVGRVVCNDFPTGVRVSEAMVHGGPFPATSDGRSTSVGTTAIERFLRPVCFQGLPDALLPEALKDANPWSLPRRGD